MSTPPQSEPLLHLLEDDVVQHKSNPNLIGHIDYTPKTGLQDSSFNFGSNVVCIHSFLLF